MFLLLPQYDLAPSRPSGLSATRMRNVPLRPLSLPVRHSPFSDAFLKTICLVALIQGLFSPLGVEFMCQSGLLLSLVPSSLLFCLLRFQHGEFGRQVLAQFLKLS